MDEVINMVIRELRDATGMSQTEFAAAYEIPVSTLRKWEQGEATPAAYIVRLIARTLPGLDAHTERIVDTNGQTYYYNQVRGELCDERGTRIYVGDEPEGVKQENLPLYVHDLFAGFYEARERFSRDCKYDKEEDIIWS